MSNLLPLDIKLIPFQEKEVVSAGYEWILPYELYDPVSDGLVDTLVDHIEKITDSNDLALGTVLRAKATDIANSATRILRNGLEIHALRKRGVNEVGQFGTTHLHKYLCGSSDLIPGPYEDTNPYYRNNGVIRPIVAMGRRIKDVMSSPFDSVDVLQRNEMMSLFLDEKGISSRVMYPFHLIYWPRVEANSHARSCIKVLTDAVLACLDDEVRSDAKLVKRLNSVVNYVIGEHIAEGLGHLKLLRRWKDWGFRGTTFYSGTPKLVGRLLSAILREEGKEVIRFTHGGERGLFSDRLWGITELTYSSCYYMHGKGEAQLIAQRAETGGTAQFTGSWEEVSAFPSKIHHEILSRSTNATKRNRNRSIVYVAQSYTGEGKSDMPSFKPPDVLLYEWQVWLLKTLKEQGYKITLKPHPRGVGKNGMHLRPYCDDVIEECFDPIIHQADCLIFDFAGTAMMNALASRNPVIYIDHGIRHFDPLGKKWLSERAEIVPCYFDQYNRFRADPSRLCEAVEYVSERNWLDAADHFVKRYF